MIAITKRIWINPPIEVPVIKPRIHRIKSIIAIVVIIVFLLIYNGEAFLLVFNNRFIFSNYKHDFAFKNSEIEGEAPADISAKRASPNFVLKHFS